MRRRPVVGDGPAADGAEHGGVRGPPVVTRGRFVRESLGFALSLYLARVVMLGRGLAAAAALGPLGFGGWNALNLIFDYGSYAAAGAIQGLDRVLPGTVARGDVPAARRIMAATWRVVILGAVAFGAALIVYLAAGGAEFAAFPGVAAPLLMLAAAILQLAFQYHASALRALGRVPAVSRAQALQAMLGGGLGLGTVWWLGVWGLLGGWLIGSLAALLLMRRNGAEVPLAPGALSEGLGIARAGLPIFGYFAITLVLRSVDRLALVHAGATESLGLYGIGLMISVTLLHLPESAAYVLFPRMAAAAEGARDATLTRDEALRVQRVLTSVLPVVIALAAVWLEPVVAWLLPAYRPGIGALRLLALGTLFFSAATVPGYALLASPRRGRLLVVSAGCALVSAALVFAAAARDPHAQTVAAAAVTGYGIFAAAIVTLAAFEWHDLAGERVRLVLTSLVPALWVGAVTWLACGRGDGERFTIALARTGVVVLTCLPLLSLARGLGLRARVRSWFGP